MFPSFTYFPLSKALHAKSSTKPKILFVKYRQRVMTNNYLKRRRLGGVSGTARPGVGAKGEALIAVIELRRVDI